MLECVRYALLGIWGHRESELKARALLQPLQRYYTHPLICILLNTLHDQLNTETWHQKRLRPFLENAEQKQISFQKDKHDPDVIVQVKKIIHILRLAEEVLFVIEHIQEEDSFFKLLKGLNYTETSEKIYELCKLLMWPDVNLVFEFEKECHFLHLCFEPIYAFFLKTGSMESLSENFEGFGAHFSLFLGLGMGTLTHPLREGFLGQFKWILPEYLEKWRLNLERCCQGRAQDFSLPPQTLEEHLLIWITPVERLFKNTFFRFGALGDVLESLKHGHRLSWALCYDVHQLKVSNQEWLKAQLNQFRLNFYLPLVSFLDKIEEKFILVPGFLTNNVVYRFECLFETLTLHLKRFVVLNQEERVLNNATLIKKRLSALYQRQADLNKRKVPPNIEEDALICVQANVSFLLMINQDIVHQIQRRWPKFSVPSSFIFEDVTAVHALPFKDEVQLFTPIATFIKERSLSFQTIFHPVVKPYLIVQQPSLKVRVINQLTCGLNEVPYPEILSSRTALKTPQTVLWIKQLANMFTHFSSALIQLDHFDTDKSHHSESQSNVKRYVTKTIYLVRVVLVEHHLRQVLWCLSDLYQQGYWHHLHQGHLMRMKPFYPALMKITPIKNILSLKSFAKKAAQLFHDAMPGDVSLFHLLAWLDFGLKCFGWAQSASTYDLKTLQDRKSSLIYFFGLILSEADALEESLLLREGFFSRVLEQWVKHFQGGFFEFSWLQLKNEIRLQRLKSLEARVAQTEKKEQILKQDLAKAKIFSGFLGQINPSSSVSDLNDACLKKESLSFDEMRRYLKDASARCEVAYGEMCSKETLSSVLDAEKTPNALNVPVLNALVDTYIDHTQGVLQGEGLIKQVRASKAACLQAEAQHRTHGLFRPEDDVGLQRIREAIADFKDYIKNQSNVLKNKEVTTSFESHDTLEKKTGCLKRLETILTDDCFTVSLKKKTLKATIQEPAFKKNMLGYHQYDKLSWAWLAQCFWRLLTVLGLYTPHCQGVYNTIAEATKNESPRFFSTSKTQNCQQGLYSYIMTSA